MCPNGRCEHGSVAVTAAHPTRREAPKEIPARAQTEWMFADRLISVGIIVEMEYNGMRFSMKRLGIISPVRIKVA